MIKKILKYLALTAAIAFAGMVLALLDLGSNEQGVGLGATSTIGLLLFLFSPVFSGLWFWIKRKRNTSNDLAEAEDQNRRDFLRHRFLERQRLIDSVDRHRAALIRNLDRAIKKNDYGALVADNKDEALEEFFASIDLDMAAIAHNEAAEVVFEQLDIREVEDKSAGFDANNLPFDGHAFERWVAEALEGFGWAAQVTSGSGDQGIDVIAERDGKKFGIQCKLYSSPIGNKAVQEAHAGKAFYGVNEVGVLSNASFTPSAKDLASVTGVHLLSHHDIPTLFDKVFSR